jgi:hypothetical protein
VAGLGHRTGEEQRKQTKTLNSHKYPSIRYPPPKTCLDFFKVIQTDEEKETMLPTVVSASQALSPDAAAQLEGKRRFIAQHLTELLASKLLHEYLLQAEKQGGSTLPPSLKGMKNPKTTAAATMVTTIESKRTRRCGST